MNAPQLVLGFDHREQLARWLTLDEWRAELDRLLDCCEIEMRCTPKGTCISDTLGLVMEIEAPLDRILEGRRS